MVNTGRQAGSMSGLVLDVYELDIFAFTLFLQPRRNCSKQWSNLGIAQNAGLPRYLGRYWSGSYAGLLI